MSPPAIGERIARLERAGVVRGYRVDIDWSALGYVTVYLAVTAIQGADQSSIMTAMHQLPEVADVLVVTGSMDMLARLRLRDHAHLRAFLLERVWQIPGIQRTETFLSLAEMPSKEFSAELPAGPTSALLRSRDPPHAEPNAHDRPTHRCGRRMICPSPFALPYARRRP